MATREEIFDVNDEVTLQVEVKDKVGEFADPTEIHFYIRTPSGDEDEVESGDITHVSTGVYKTLYYPDIPGEWNWRAETSGDINQTADGRFFVRTPAVKGSSDGPELTIAKLSPLALCTVEEVVDLLGLDEEDAALRQQTIIRTINAASRALPRRAQRDFIVPVADEENPESTRWYELESADQRRRYVRVGDLKAEPSEIALVTPDRDETFVYDDADWFVLPDTPDYGWPFEFIRFKSTTSNPLQTGWWVKVTAEWGFPIVPDDIRQIAIGTAAKWVANDVLKLTELARQQGRSVPMTSLIPAEFLDTVDEFRTFRVA